ncbi:MAG: hypothetical protein UY41_C0008G0005 [Candidatus Moranbacteria bacterium GW2011_GWE1_49_15]|nr:MAG: hypothetical protein UY41_C0008G0005 [Candidatus Moranbacteria bacterium GW2011_GWE1_49_15]HBP01318.1 hypothetical protein [Candidatus Moranbacteria bacterium]
MKTKLKKISYWAGVGAVGIVLGISLQFTRAWVEPTVAPPGGSIGAPINTGDVTQKKTGNIGFGIDVPVPGIAVMGQGSLSGGWFVGDPAGSGNALTLGTYGTGKALSAYEGTSFFEDAVGIGEGTTTISAGLLLDVHGKVGASEYCDQNGANCKTITMMGGGIADFNSLPRGDMAGYCWESGTSIAVTYASITNSVGPNFVLSSKCSCANGWSLREIGSKVSGTTYYRYFSCTKN